MTSDTGVASILGFERKSEKDKANGYAGLNSSREIGEFFPKIASGSLRHSHNAIASGNFEEYFKLKTFTFQYEVVGTATVKFNAKNNTSGTTNYAQIYKNGIAIGTERAVTTTGMTTFVEDITLSLEPGGTIELWGKTSGITILVENFQIYYDNIPDRVEIPGVTVS